MLGPTAFFLMMYKYEILIPDGDFALDTISDIEDPLDQALMAAAAGEVTGGGIGHGWYRLELELLDVDTALEISRTVARAVGLPDTTLVREVTTQKTIRLLGPTG